MRGRDVVRISGHHYAYRKATLHITVWPTMAYLVFRRLSFACFVIAGQEHSWVQSSCTLRMSQICGNIYIIRNGRNDGLKKKHRRELNHVDVLGMKYTDSGTNKRDRFRASRMIVLTLNHKRPDTARRKTPHRRGWSETDLLLMRRVKAHSPTRKGAFQM